jgi:hypothetical protein
MGITTLNTLFNYMGIFAAILVVISTIGTFWTGKIIDGQKSTQVQSLQKQLSDLKPSIFSQTTESINVLEDNLYKQTFKVSVDAPASNGIVVTHLTSRANRVGRTEISPLSNSGVRIRNKVLVSFQDYIYSFSTDKPLDMQTDSVSFSYDVNEWDNHIIF